MTHFSSLRRLPWRSPFLPPLALASLIIATSPFMGLLRDAVFAVFPRQGLQGVAWTLAGLAGALFLGAVYRIREYRVWRYGGLVLVALLLTWQVVGLGRGVAQVDVVERIHLVEYGSLAWLLYRAWRLWGASRLELFVLPLLATLVAGAADESAQRLFFLRVGDYRDVLLNGLAAICGLIFAAVFDPPLNTPPTQTAQKRRIASALALTLLAVGFFVDYAHLGYEIRDPQLGSFLSYFSPAELETVSAARRERWAYQPPIDLKPWHLKDLYLDEAARHTNYRNDRYAAGDWLAAWQSNALLEKYYEPFLDVGGFRGSGPNRWNPAQKAEVAQLVGEAPALATRRSPVLEGHLLPWPHGRYRAVWLGLVLMAALVAATLEPRAPARRTY